MGVVVGDGGLREIQWKDPRGQFSAAERRLAVALGMESGSSASARSGEVLRRGGLARDPVVPGSLFPPEIDTCLQLSDHLLQCGPQGVIGRLGDNIRPRRDEMRADSERRAGVLPVFDQDTSHVDLQNLTQSLDALQDESGERG